MFLMVLVVSEVLRVLLDVPLFDHVVVIFLVLRIVFVALIFLVMWSTLFVPFLVRSYFVPLLLTKSVPFNSWQKNICWPACPWTWLSRWAPLRHRLVFRGPVAPSYLMKRTAPIPQIKLSARIFLMGLVGRR
ncbi:unnamed protein product [Prorocentrum cordatum]|uniref:Transmembrane protein 138 n=1 Tax=Prorocentrum cordatum TaxID=2364126 RepID=A0ABN9Q757_9DINO|nr:unnamed protein product [Polarella glacialis]